MPTIKLIDFGTAKLTASTDPSLKLSKQMSSQIGCRITEAKGTWVYMAPEVQRFMWQKMKRDEAIKKSIKAFNEKKGVISMDSNENVLEEGLVFDKNGYDNKCDMWSVGVIAYIILCGQHPFSLEQSQD